MYHHGRLASICQLMSLYTDSLATLTRQFYGNTHKTDRIIRARHLMDAQLGEPITLAQLAAIACCSPSHFCREFRRLYGLSPRAYLIRKRVARARQLLAGRESVLDVCLAVGYESISTFSGLIKKQTGRPPRAHKRARLKN